MATPKEKAKVGLRSTTTRERCRHTLTIDQMVEAGKRLAECQLESQQIEDDFKSFRDDWKARRDAVDSRITMLSDRISRGDGMKYTECTVVMDQPDTGFKTCLRDDTGEKVWVREMSESDKHMSLDLEEKEEF